MAEENRLKEIATPQRIRDLARAVHTIECYGKFTQGQDGFAALLILKSFVNDLQGELSPYGYCPHCLGKGISRERRPNGNDQCENGHVYPSSVARQ